MTPAAAQETMRLGDPGVITAKGHHQKDHGDGTVSFQVDASDYLYPWNWPVFLMSRYTAVIFSGKNDADRACVYFPKNRPHTLTRKEGLTYRVDTSATPEEIRTIEADGCVITDSPSLRELGLEEKKPDSPFLYYGN